MKDQKMKDVMAILIALLMVGVLSSIVVIYILAHFIVKYW